MIRKTTMGWGGDKLRVLDPQICTTICKINKNNKDLLYHTGDHIQYLIITNNVKESQKQYTLTCITESLSAVYLKHNIVNELCFN